MIGLIFLFFGLLALQVVLGFDNLLAIAIESNRAPEASQKKVRSRGILIAIGMRIALLVLLLWLMETVNVTFGSVHSYFMTAEFNFENCFMMFGGLFVIWMAIKGIAHMLNIDDEKPKPKASPTRVILSIVWMNLIFSFDSILSAMAMSKNVWLLSAAIVAGGLLMLWLSDKVAAFIKKNREYEVMGLMILLIVGGMMFSEGAHLAEMYIFGREMTAMSSGMFYTLLVVLVITEVIQTIFKKKRLK
jgi:predicted tellurium resistance membrane protein TerC